MGPAGLPGLSGGLLHIARRVLDNRHYPWSHEPGHPHGLTRPGHLKHLDHASTGRHLDAASRFGGNDVKLPHASADVHQDLDSVTLHNLKARSGADRVDRR